MIYLSENFFYLVVVPSYNSRVRFENYCSMLKYTQDLKKKEINYTLKIEYNEPETIYKKPLEKLQ